MVHVRHPIVGDERLDRHIPSVTSSTKPTIIWNSPRLAYICGRALAGTTVPSQTGTATSYGFMRQRNRAILIDHSTAVIQPWG
jgi:hypothetical protein